MTRFDVDCVLTARFHMDETAAALHVAYWMHGRDSGCVQHHADEARRSLLKAFGCSTPESLALKIASARTAAIASGAGTETAYALAVVDMLFEQIGLPRGEAPAAIEPGAAA
jgi:hypothetical protein